ncbi:MAG: hypothetical protein WCT52_05650 [Candidatus Micrarchaeia archaeon]
MSKNNYRIAVSIALFSLLLSNTAHAAMDVSYSFGAIVAGIAFIGLGYMATYLFNAPQIRAMLQDELVQVMASGAMLLIIAGVALEVDVFVVSAMRASDPAGSYTGITSAMDAANSVIGGNINNANWTYNAAHDTSLAIGREGSKSLYCTFIGVGYSLNNCGQLNAFRGSLTTIGFVASAALADLFAQQALISLVRNLAFTFLIPIGLFFRCFKASRRAGGAFIAIGFGFYTVYPVATVATDRMLQASVSLPDPILPSVDTCDPYETDNSRARVYVQDYATRLSDFGGAESIIYTLLVRIVFSSMFCLLVTLGFIRAFSQMIGSDIDVSSLARIS